MADNATTTEGMSDQFLDFEKAKVQVLTMDQLRRTQPESDVYGKPINGVYHHVFFDKVNNLCNKIGYKTEFYDLFAAQNKDGGTPGVTLIEPLQEKYGERRPEAYIIRRVFANIRILDFDTDDLTTNLAISYSQKGIQVGFGNMVQICHNQCMLSADKFLATYYGNDREKVTPDILLDNLQKWLDDARATILADRQRIERMKNQDLTADELYKIIGLLNVLAVRKGHPKRFTSPSPVQVPLGMWLLNSFTERIWQRYEENNNITLWDVYDSSTEEYKPNRLDTTLILPQNLNMVSFLEEQFQF